MQLDVGSTARDIASYGWPVFPCSPVNKAPLVQRGLYAASLDEAQIAAWWAQWPIAMIGLPTGAVSGVWVLDIDLKDDGPDQLDALIAQHGPLPETLTVETASGGRHYYWTHQDGVRNRGRLAAGIDVRGDGGYVIAPGSVRDDGTYYEVKVDTDPVPAPDWLLDLVIKKSAGSSAFHDDASGAINVPYVEAAVAGEMEKLVSTRAGRNNALNDAAFALGQFVGAGAMSRHDAESRLFGAAMANGYVGKDGEAAARATISSGLASGEAQPRVIPQGIVRDDAGIEAWMPHRFLEKERAKSAAAVSGAETAPETAAGGYDHIRESGNSAAVPKVAPKADDDDRAVTATPFELGDPTKLPRREFLYGTHLIRKYVSVTVAPGGLGKTSLSIAETLAMTTGRALLGTKPPGPLRVWLFNAEDPREEMERRLAAASLHYGIGVDDIGGRLFLDTGREQPIMVAHEDRATGFHINVPILDALVDEIARYGIDVMIIDPFVSTHGVSENDNSAIDRVVKLWGQVAEVTNCAIEVVHHVRKSDGREVTVDDARGANALLAAARSARVLNRMSPEQASAAGLGDDERLSFFSVTRGKSNLAPLMAGAEWRRLVSVGLGNGIGLQKPQDHAGVVTEWKWPSSEEAVSGVSADALAAILARVQGGDYRENEQANDWVGRIVAEVLSLEADDKGVKKRIKRMVSRWLAEGILELDERRNAKGEYKKYVVVPPP